MLKIQELEKRDLELIVKYEELAKHNSRLQDKILKYQYEELRRLDKKFAKEFRDYSSKFKNKRSTGSKPRVKEKRNL